MKRKAKRISPKQANEDREVGKNFMAAHDGMGKTMPPDISVLQIYFDQKGNAELAVEFFNEHQLRHWKTPTGGTIYNWKVCAAEWIYNYHQEEKRRLKQSPFYCKMI